MTSQERTYANGYILQRPEAQYRAGICLCSFPDRLEHDEFERLLHPRERTYYSTLRFEKRRNSYLIGRYAAKKALSAVTGERELRNIAIHHGVFNQPVVTYAHGQNMQVSISHCDEFGAALAFPEGHPLGIDIEKIDSGRSSVLEGQLTVTEQDLVRKASCARDEMLALLWTVKEAMSKILRTGLTAPLSLFSVSKIEMTADAIVSHFDNFGQYRGISFVGPQAVCSIVCPKRTEMTLNAAAVKKILNLSTGGGIENNDIRRSAGMIGGKSALL